MDVQNHKTKKKKNPVIKTRKGAWIYGFGLTDNALDFGDQATRWRRGGFLREVTGVEDVVDRRAVLAVVQQLVMLGVLKNENKITNEITVKVNI